MKPVNLKALKGSIVSPYLKSFQFHLKDSPQDLKNLPMIMIMRLHKKSARLGPVTTVS